MSEQVLAATKKAIEAFGNAAAKEYLRRMAEEEKLFSTKCRECGEIAWPPREFCPFCQHGEIEWVELGEDATLYAFTRQERSLRFSSPEVIGVAEIPGVGKILTAIDGKYEDLEIGMALKLGFVEILDGVKVHRYKPV